MRKIAVSFLVLSVLIFTACGTTSSGSFSYKGIIKPGRWINSLKIDIGAGHSVKYAIYFPKGYVKGESIKTVLALHGYAGNYREWGSQTQIEKFANEGHFAVVCPNMGKSLYASRYYKETKLKWSIIPGGEFIMKIFIPYLRNHFNLALGKDKTAIVGVSTGARGALLLAAKYPDSFGLAVGLSGDYDQTSMPKDRLVTSVYGKYKDNPQRWKNDDNVITFAKNLKNIPVYLSHGGSDYVVPRGQSLILALKLKMLRRANGGDYIMEYKELKHLTHDWKVWRRMLPDVVVFMQKNWLNK